jgi:deazaflavin-dependent oxidoreductase (nitroreductase family)
MNPLMGLLLRSPFHSRLSKNIMLLTFTGRKSGKQYTTPVGYLQQGDRLTVFTHSSWWKNLRGGAPVKMYLRGRGRSGRAEVVTAPETVKQMVRALIAKDGEEMARRMGFWVASDDPSAAELQAVMQHTVFVQIQLDGGA